MNSTEIVLSSISYQLDMLSYFDIDGSIAEKDAASLLKQKGIYLSTADLGFPGIDLNTKVRLILSRRRNPQEKLFISKDIRTLLIETDGFCGSSPEELAAKLCLDLEEFLSRLRRLSSSTVFLYRAGDDSLPYCAWIDSYFSSSEERVVVAKELCGGFSKRSEKGQEQVGVWFFPLADKRNGMGLTELLSRHLFAHKDFKLFLHHLYL